MGALGNGNSAETAQGQRITGQEGCLGAGQKSEGYCNERNREFAFHGGGEVAGCSTG